jgi:dihydropteroate synthase
MKKSYILEWGAHRLELGDRTCVMGIVNVTPDSFSDGGRFFSRDRAVAHGLQLAEEGADILDIGGESTRPFADAVSTGEELDRVIPVIETLAGHVDIPISIDTTKADVAEQALAAGAAIINDVSALRQDPALAGVAARHGVPLILMHMLGSPRTMQVDPKYDNVVDDITAFLADAVDRATRQGIDRRLIVVDPGIGFGKTVEHNLALVRHLDRLEALDAPILIGLSRKAFIRRILKKPTEEDVSPDREDVEIGTQAAQAAAVMAGAHIVRAHNVANTRAAAAVADALRRVFADETG